MYVHWAEYFTGNTECNVVPLEKEGDFRGFRVTYDKEKFDIPENSPFKLRIRVPGCDWESESTPTIALGKGWISPGFYGWIFYDKKD